MPTAYWPQALTRRHAALLNTEVADVSGNDNANFVFAKLEDVFYEACAAACANLALVRTGYFESLEHLPAFGPFALIAVDMAALKFWAGHADQQELCDARLACLWRVLVVSVFATACFVVEALVAGRNIWLRRVVLPGMLAL